MNTVELKKDGLYLNGEHFFMLGGDFHYFRTLPGGWKRRMELMKDFGLNCITTYVPWNAHEPREGEFCFEGIYDLPLFLQTAQEVGLKVILRCSPYICAEWDGGGIPSWLLKKNGVCIRSCEEQYMNAVKNYFKVLGEKVKPYMFSNGGPIILAGLENEYGSFGNDIEYLKELAKIYRDSGIDVPLSSANGVDPFKYLHGTIEESWNGADAGADPSGIIDLKSLSKLQPNKPLMAGEAWVGNIMFWGKNFTLGNNIGVNAAYYKEALSMGASVNFYMFCGGTNFGFTSGALSLRDEEYLPLLTSYDYDAPISEEGIPREKYFALRDVLDEFLGKEKRAHIVPEYYAQSIENIELCECSSLLENSKSIAEKDIFSHRVKSMEELDQSSGFILYSTELKYTDSRKRHLKIEGLCDRATVYLNKKYIGTYMRDRKNADIVFTVPETGATLEILVENMGRIDYGYKMYEYKGINGCVHFEIEQPDGSFLWNYANCIGYQIKTLPLNSTNGLVWGEYKEEYKNTPVFYKGTFSAKPGVDTFIDTKGLTRGVIYINGFNIGRFWNVGPQRTLYIPGELLKEYNTIEILELHSKSKSLTVSCIDHNLLTEPVGTDETLIGFELK